ncbi:ParB/RepB/Spo0J family partition protein [Georgenia soli]
MEPDKSRSRSKSTTSRKRVTDRKSSASADEASATSAPTPNAGPAAEATPVADDSVVAAEPVESAGKTATEGLPEVPPSDVVASGVSSTADVASDGATTDEVSSVDRTPGDDTPGDDTAGDDTPGDAASTDTATTVQEQADDGGLLPVPGATFAEVPVDLIVPNTRQPRQVFDEEDLDELAASIREVGVLQPVVVRPLQGASADGPQYELIMGERRWRASQQAGNDTVPAIIRDTGDGQLLRDALLENLHRADLNPLEEAAAYQQLLEDFGCTHDELASRIARSRPQISNTLRLLKLPPLVQRRVAAGVLSAGHARALLGLSDGAAMERLAQKIVAEGLSVRATEEIVALGDEPVAPEMRRRPRASAHAEDLNRLATRLADRLDTRVKVNLGQRKGRIAIEFASVEDLNRILDVLAPGEEHISAS